MTKNKQIYRLWSFPDNFEKATIIDYNTSTGQVVIRYPKDSKHGGAGKTYVLSRSEYYANQWADSKLLVLMKEIERAESEIENSRRELKNTTRWARAKIKKYRKEIDKNYSNHEKGSDEAK